jgi:branched-chain amino acid transport system permease protein
MTEFLTFTVAGLVTGAIYAVAASGLVVTYTTSGIFNFAHGAIGMFMAFVYWQLHEAWGWPTVFALPIVVFAIAPLFGAAIERFLMRGLVGAPATTSMVVTVGLMVALIGAAQTIWDPSVGRQMPRLFGFSGFRLFGVLVTWHEFITMLVAIGVAVGLRLLLFRTRVGTAMRAVVDDRNLVSLNGGRPGSLSMLSWAIGSSLAALAGILLAPILQLDPLILTLLVVNAYAAAMVGRLKSLPLTFAGAMALGLAQSYAVAYFPFKGITAQLQPSVPTILLFAILLLMPEARLRAARLLGGVSPRVPNLSESVGGAVLFVAVAVGLAQVLSGADLIRVGSGLSFGLIMLSLVLLTGYGGQASLCQMTFAGVGAYAMSAFGDGSPVGLLMAVALAAPLGALVALPALRLQGLYLALATMAFAVLADNLLFPHFFGNLGSKTVPRLDLFGLSFESEQSYFVLLAVAFALFGVFVLALKRGRFGRRLAAMRDSPAACATLGMNIPRTKLAVFTISAAMAGFAGALFGGLRGAAGPTDFVMYQSLPVLLLAVLGGITTPTGALIGGLMFAYLPTLVPSNLQGLVFVSSGLGGVMIAKNPNGMAFFISQALEPLAVWRRPKGPQAPEELTLDREVARVAAS